MFHRTLLSLWLIFALLLSACAAPATAPAGVAPAADTPAAAPADGRTVAILVVDKFTDVSSEEVKPNDNYPEGEGCVILPSGSDYISRGGGGNEHGRLVWSTITEELSKTHRAQQYTEILDADLWKQLAVNGASAEYSQLWHIPDVGNIRLIPVDIGDFDTATVVTGITDALMGLNESEEQIDRVVVNMSWVILPADACRPTTVADYMNAVCSVTSENGLSDLFHLTLINILLDALGRGDTSFNENIMALLDEKKPQLAEILRRSMADGRQSFPDITELENTSRGVTEDSISNVICTGEWGDNAAQELLQLLLEPRLLIYWLESVYNKEMNSLDLTNPDDLAEKYGTYANPPESEQGTLFKLLSQLSSCQPAPNGDVCPLHTISIAAAGNAGLKFPFMPGLWDSVVSVSAADGLNTGDFLSDDPYSNWAEVALDGHHPFEIQLVQGVSIDCVEGFDCSLYNNKVVGTSYAAPRLSVLAARYLLQGGENPCTTQPGSITVEIRPPLGYDTVNAQLPMDEWWKNYTVAEAADLYCEEFPRP